MLEYDKGRSIKAKELFAKALNIDDEKLKGIIYESLSRLYASDNKYKEAYRHNLQELDQIKKDIQKI